MSRVRRRLLGWRLTKGRSRFHRLDFGMVLHSGFECSPEDERIGRGDDTVGNPNRAQIYKFELFKLILLLKLDKQFPGSLSSNSRQQYLSQQYPTALLQPASRGRRGRRVGDGVWQRVA